MSPASAKSGKDAGSALTNLFSEGFPFTNFYKSELMWAPARAMANAMLQTQRNVTTMVQINRKLVDELQDIARREQDAMLNLSGKVLEGLAQSNGGPSLDTPFSTDAIEAVYDTALTGMRELGQAVADAQSRSMTALRDHAQATADMASHSVEQIKTAA